MTGPSVTQSPCALCAGVCVCVHKHTPIHTSLTHVFSCVSTIRWLVLLEVHTHVHTGRVCRVKSCDRKRHEDRSTTEARPACPEIDRFELCTRTHARTHTHAHTHAHARAHTHTHTHAHAHAHTRTHTHTQLDPAPAPAACAMRGEEKNMFDNNIHRRNRTTKINLCY